jgi:hypothetical protein
VAFDMRGRLDFVDDGMAHLPHWRGRSGLISFGAMAKGASSWFLRRGEIGDNPCRVSRTVRLHLVLPRIVPLLS